MSSTRRRVRCGAVLVTALLPGCYNYVPVDALRSQPETEVRIHLTEDGSAHLATTYEGRAPSVEGRLLESNAGEVVLQVNPQERWMAVAGGTVPTIRVPHDAILRMEVKRLDTRRSVIAAAGFATVLGIMLYSRLGDTGYKGVPDGSDGSDAYLAPITP